MAVASDPDEKAFIVYVVFLASKLSIYRVSQWNYQSLPASTIKLSI